MRLLVDSPSHSRNSRPQNSGPSRRRLARRVAPEADYGMRIPKSPLRSSALLASATLALSSCASLGRNRPAAIQHVFIIVLENKGFDTTFRAGTDAPYF